MSEDPVMTSPRARWIVEITCAALGVWLILWAWRADRHWFEVHTLDFYSCTTDPKELGRASFERVVAVVVGALLLLVARPRLGRWVGSRTPRAALGALARIAVAFVLALLACEGILRLKHDPPGPPTLHWEPISDADPVLHWRPARSRTTEHKIGDKVVAFHIDANGWRVKSPDEVVDFDRPTILFTGESVASGFGLPYEDTYPSMIGDDLHVQVVNVAVQGYGSDQAYLRMHEALPRFHHPVAAVTLVVPTQIHRNVAIDRPRLGLNDDGTFFPVPRHDDDWLAPLRRSRLAGVYEKVFGYHSDEAFRIARAIYVATAKEARARGAFPLFVLTSWGAACLPDDTGLPPLEHNLFDGLNVEHISVDPPPDAWDEAIQHTGPRGHRAIADAIEHSLREHALFPQPGTTTGGTDAADVH